jgi:hypothetical protein
MEAVFQPEVIRWISAHCLCFLVGTDRKNPRNFRLEYCLQNSPEIHWILPYIFDLGKNNP